MSVPVAVGEGDVADAVEPPPGAVDAGGWEDDVVPPPEPLPAPIADVAHAVGFDGKDES